jgi:hypothetical protein
MRLQVHGWSLLFVLLLTPTTGVSGVALAAEESVAPIGQATPTPEAATVPTAPTEEPPAIVSVPEPMPVAVEPAVPPQALTKKGDVVDVTSSTAVVYTQPDSAHKTSKNLKQGQQLRVAGTVKNGFIPLSTKGGRTVWVKAADTNATLSPQDLAATDNSEPKRGMASLDGKLGVQRVTYDIGIGAGSYANQNYVEGDIGLNLYFKDYLAWRNAIFGRFVSPTNYYGLDSSVRGILNLGDQAFGFTAFAGPGIRFPTIGNIAPFLEGGAVLKIGGIALGVGVKSILDSWVVSGAGNDTEYYLIIAGGGSL